MATAESQPRLAGPGLGVVWASSASEVGSGVESNGDDKSTQPKSTESKSESRDVELGVELEHCACDQCTRSSTFTLRDNSEALEYQLNALEQRLNCAGTRQNR